MRLGVCAGRRIIDSDNERILVAKWYILCDIHLSVYLLHRYHFPNKQKRIHKFSANLQIYNIFPTSNPTHYPYHTYTHTHPPPTIPVNIYSRSPASAALKPINKPSTSCLTTTRRLSTTTSRARRRLLSARTSGWAKANAAARCRD